MKWIVEIFSGPQNILNAFGSFFKNSYLPTESESDILLLMINPNNQKFFDVNIKLNY